MTHDVKRAVAARNAAHRRVRVLTAAAVTAGVALSAAFASLAAGSTHLKKVVQRTAPVRSAKPVVAPAPHLVPVHTTAPPPAPAPAPSAVPSPGPAVVVSGGS